MEKLLVNLSRTISHALRHAPWQYELELDDAGWTSLEDLLQALRQHRRQWQPIGLAELERIQAESDKQRFEIKDGRIRAFYGHSVPTKLRKEPAQPPERLYHGTDRQFLTPILRHGLKPMRRQYVHLSSEQETALQVGQRKGEQPVILTVRSGEAHRLGQVFYHGNEMVWLTDMVSPEFIDLPE